MSLLGRIPKTPTVEAPRFEASPDALKKAVSGGAEVGLGPVSHVPTRTGRRRPLSAALGGILVTAVAAVLLATTPAAAQTVGAPLDAAPTTVEQTIAPAKAEAGSRWERVELAPEQVVVSRFYEGHGVAGRVKMQVPWPDDAPQDIESAGLLVFARDDAATAHVEDGVLHLGYTTDRGLVESLRSGAVFHLRAGDGTLHLLSVNAPAFTVDDTQLYRQEAERHVASLERRVAIVSKFDDAASIADAQADLAKARSKLAEFDAGRTFTHIHE